MPNKIIQVALTDRLKCIESELVDLADVIRANEKPNIKKYCEIKNKIQDLREDKIESDSYKMMQYDYSISMYDSLVKKYYKKYKSVFKEFYKNLANKNINIKNLLSYKIPEFDKYLDDKKKIIKKFVYGITLNLDLINLNTKEKNKIVSVLREQIGNIISNLESSVVYDDEGLKKLSEFTDNMLNRGGILDFIKIAVKNFKNTKNDSALETDIYQQI